MKLATIQTLNFANCFEMLAFSVLVSFLGQNIPRVISLDSPAPSSSITVIPPPNQRLRYGCASQRHHSLLAHLLSLTASFSSSPAPLVLIVMGAYPPRHLSPKTELGRGRSRRVAGTMEEAVGRQHAL